MFFIFTIYPKHTLVLTRFEDDTKEGGGDRLEKGILSINLFREEVNEIEH